MIRHLVLMKLTDPSESAEAKARLESLPADIPQILSLEVVLDVLRTEASFDLALVTTHKDLEMLQAYQAHPVHEAFLAWVRPRLAGRAVVDAEV